VSGGEGGKEAGAEEIIVPAPGATDLLAALGSGLVIAAYLVGGSAAAARAVAVAALPTALLLLVSARVRRYAVYLYTVALSAVFAGLFCCALDPYFWATATAAVASFAWTLTQRARRARLAQPQLRV
jgi:hypothetical protein